MTREIKKLKTWLMLTAICAIGATSCKTETKQNESKNYKLSGLIRTRKSQQPILLPSKECRTLTSILK
ncbi:hypothetical protein [Phocaeicola coprophilus]|uniref:hypothetical protein n=1 Tax=Phocaeicola coprophilus TaxID=387090 RepID=UPI0039942C96